MDEADIAKLLQNEKFVEISPEYIVERINSYRQQVKYFIHQQKKTLKKVDCELYIAVVQI